MKIAFLCPGQGSQELGMGRELCQNFPEASQTFEEASDQLGWDLRAICHHESDAAKLQLTQYAQPAILTLGVALYRVFSLRMQVSPAFAAGHSLGEYTALVLLEGLDFGDAVRVVHQRGLLMSKAIPSGESTMAAILGMDGAELEALCLREAGEEIVVPANYNAPGQIVISGHTRAVERVLQHARGKRLNVSAAFHSPLMAPAAEKLGLVLEEVTFHDTRAPVVTNAENRFLSEASAFPLSLTRQMTAPVLWETGIGSMVKAGAELFIEMGHGRVLAGINRRLPGAKDLPTCSVRDEASLGETCKTLEKLL